MVLNPVATAMADKIENCLGGSLERDRPHEAAVDLDPTRSKPAPATKFPADPGLDQKLVKIGARIVRHGRYVVFQSGRGGGAAGAVRRDPASDR
jgi:hypothetical protein